MVPRPTLPLPPSALLESPLSRGPGAAPMQRQLHDRLKGAILDLKKQGKTFDFFHYPDEQHGIRRPQNFVDAYSRMEAWFAKYLQ